MKRLAVIMSATLALTAILGSSVSADNGAPQGNHDYQVNIIGTTDKNDASGDWGGQGHRIFVDLWGETRIALSEGDYGVLDANGTDGWASFQLPAPGLDAFVIGEETSLTDVESDYSVFIRPLGKPGGWATITTCADLLDSTFAGLLGSREVKTIENAIDPVTGAYCSIEQVGNTLDGDLRTFRSSGKTVFSNVTAELTTIVFEVTVDTDGDGIADDTLRVRVPIFHDLLEDEYWLYDNHGLRVLQVRFYDCSTNVATGTSSC